MELRKNRFNQNWGIACGPVCGDTSVECMFYDDMKHSFFVYDSILDMGLLLGISKVSIFDIMNNDLSIEARLTGCVIVDRWSNSDSLDRKDLMWESVIISV